MKKKIIQLGVVGVDSGQLMICDPCYIDSEMVEGGDGNKHEIYRHKSGQLWQFTYGKPTADDNIKSFPGSYETVIPEYNKTPNQMIKDGDFTKTDIDPNSDIPNGEFSYAGICKVTTSKNRGGQLNYKHGHEGVAVAFTSGFGDGVYPVFAELVQTDFGERVSKVWVDLQIEEGEDTMFKLLGIEKQ